MKLLCQIKDQQGNVHWSEELSSDYYNILNTPEIENDAIQAAVSSKCDINNRILHVESEDGSICIRKTIDFFLCKV